MKLVWDTIKSDGTELNNKRSVPAAGDGGYFTERQLEKNLFLVVDNVHSCPVDGNDNLVLRQTRPRKLVCLVEAREQQRPLVLGIVDDVFFHGQRRHSLFHKVAVSVCARNCLQKPSTTILFNRFQWALVVVCLMAPIIKTHHGQFGLLTQMVLKTCCYICSLSMDLLHGGAAVGHWTCDWQVTGSIPSRSAFT